MYNFSDAWFLTTALLLSENPAWITLQQLIAVGDLINHAIFTKEEINRALSIYTTMNYIEINDARQMRVTSKALELCNIGFKKAGTFRKIEVVLKKLQKMPCCEIHNTYEFFSNQELEQAYNSYVKSFN